MLVLDNTTRSLELDLDGAVSSTQLTYVTTYMDKARGQEGLAGSSNGVSNNGTAVTIVPAPSREDARREIMFISVFNGDNATRTVTIQYNDNTTVRTIASFALATLEHLYYTPNTGFYAVTTAGAIK